MVPRLDVVGVGAQWPGVGNPREMISRRRRQETRSCEHRHPTRTPAPVLALSSRLALALWT